MKLGIAGTLADTEGAIAIARRLGVAPVFVLGPDDNVPGNAPPESILRVPAWGVEACLGPIKGAGFSGLWAAAFEARPAVAEVARRLNLPALSCTDHAQQATLPIEDMLVMEIGSLERLPEASRRALPLPLWVRAVCGDGDASCMRVEHVNDLGLAASKLRKRRVDGEIRVQPAVDGDIYRLMAFKTGRDLVPFDLVAEESTTSVYRVPLGLSMPVPRRGTLLSRIVAVAADVNTLMPIGWGYVEMEFVDTGEELRLVDVQLPASLDPRLRELVWKSQGVDLLQAVFQCALGRPPSLSPTREVGVAMSWLLTRSGVVTSIQGVEKARQMPGVDTVQINAKEGDTLSHVVDIPSRERGGYILTIGSTVSVARARLAEARDAVWINTSPALA